MDRRKGNQGRGPGAEPAAITIATVPYFLCFDTRAEREPRWLCVSPIESDGSGLPPLTTGRTKGA